MFVMAKEFVGALKAAALFASTDETRLHMNCVHVEAVGGALRFTATDGHTLWSCEIEASDAATDPAPLYQTPWNVGLADVPRIAASLKDCDQVPLLLPSRTLNRVPYDQRAEDFARYCNVVPSLADAKPGKCLPEFAVEYIARCCEAFTIYGKGMAPPLLTTGNKHEKQLARATRGVDESGHRLACR